jgi:hypothetical protein
LSCDALLEQAPRLRARARMVNRAKPEEKFVIGIGL